MRLAIRAAAAIAFLALASTPAAPASQGWQPTRPVQLLVPAGPAGGADRMARVIQAAVAERELMRQPVLVLNKPGGGGAEAFLELKGARGNPHMIALTLSNLFTTPLATAIPFKWSDLTPVTMLALDEFVLWVNAAAPYTTVQQFLDAGRESLLGFGGTGSRQEDRLIVAAITRASGVAFTYLPFSGGGAVVDALAAREVEATVNNPIEAVALWRAGSIRPLCVFDEQRLSAPERAAGDEGGAMAWGDIPTCRESGLDVSYLMLRGVFMPPGVAAEQVAFYVDLFDRLRATREWKELMREGAFRPAALSGEAFVDWLEREDARHRRLMTEAGLAARR